MPSVKHPNLYTLTLWHLRPYYAVLAAVTRSCSKHCVELMLADMDAVDMLQLMVVKGGTGAGTATAQPNAKPNHAKDQPGGAGWSKFKEAMQSGAELAAAASAVQPEAWGLQHAEVLQQDTGEKTYFVAGVFGRCMNSAGLMLSVVSADKSNPAGRLI